MTQKDPLPAEPGLSHPVNPLLILGASLLLLAGLVRLIWQLRPQPIQQSTPQLAMDDSAAILPLDPPPLPTNKLALLRTNQARIAGMSGSTPEERRNIAQAALDMGDLWKAEDLAKELRQRDRKDRTATLILADSLRRQARFVEAEALYQELVKSDSHDSDAYLGLADTAFAANHRPEAFAWLTRGVAQGAQTTLSLCTFAHRYQDWKDYPRAEETAQKALHLAPNDSYATLQLASAQVEGGRLDAARQTLEALIQREPNNALALRLLAVALVNADPAHQDTNRARALLEKAADINPKDLDIYRPAAVIYRQQHLYRLAAQAYDAVLRLDALSIDGRYGLGQVYALLGKSDLSREQLAIYKILDERRRRISLLTEDIVHHPISPETHAALARYYEQIDEPGRALPEYQAAASLAPRNPTYRQDLNRFYTRLGWELPKR